MGEPWGVVWGGLRSARFISSNGIRDKTFLLHPSGFIVHLYQIFSGFYEVGVHIADVSYFVTENTKLDKVAQSRATSVYLVQKVRPLI